MNVDRDIDALCQFYRAEVPIILIDIRRRFPRRHVMHDQLFAAHAAEIDAAHKYSYII